MVVHKDAFLRRANIKNGGIYLEVWSCLGTMVALGSYTPVSVPYSLFTLTNLKVSHTAQP